MSPAGLTTTEPPGNPFPPSNPTRLANATHTPCSSAMPRRMRSHRTTLAGSRVASSSIPVPRAGDALGTITSWAPWSAAIVPESECHASSDKNRRPTPARVERPDLAAAIHEPLLVEHPVRGEEHLAVHVPHARVLAAERGVQTRVVEVVLEHLVEPDRDVDGRGSRGLVLDGEIAEQRPRRHRHVPDAPFDEVAGGSSLGKNHQVHRRVELLDLRQHAADLQEIGAVVALRGAELRDSEA